MIDLSAVAPFKEAGIGALAREARTYERPDLFLAKWQGHAVVITRGVFAGLVGKLGAIDGRLVYVMALPDDVARFGESISLEYAHSVCPLSVDRHEWEMAMEAIGCRLG